VVLVALAPDFTDKALALPTHPTSQTAPMIYIWVRATLDWQDEAAFYAQLPPRLVDKVEIWNSTFKLPFHLFRHRVREIARLNHSRVEGALCAQWDAIPEGSVVVPVDDDDWFAPNLARVLAREQESGLSGYYWRSHFLEVPIHLRHQAGRIRRRLLPSTPPVFLCTTNNYAMVKQPGIELLVQQHTHASTWFESNLDTAVKKIDEPLSLMNRSLASTTSLKQKRPPFARAKMLLAWHRYRYLYRQSNNPDLAWSQPYQEMMRELTEELR
jgi:hypothetical protein